ncbi:hypothetical protein [Rufibacter sp. LB8]|uniref:hypothetical protein n=1 Tax=Rufibacter sp. LB8 TaxID=2777781 RepID=UPI00178C1A45|nr:hypothetical protein [Rufibacter sp. LB8]
MEVTVEALLPPRLETLVSYSPYTFIREIKPADQFDLFVKPVVEKFGVADNAHLFTVEVSGQKIVFLYEYLPWDSTHFKKDCLKLYTVLFSKQDPKALVKAIELFKEDLKKYPRYYLFAEIPAEDIFLIQCLNATGLRMVETRLHYYKKKLEDFTSARYPVRKATPADIEALSAVAAQNRNIYDRLHADYTFSEQEADQYLATYATAAVNGFCHEVLVPNENTIPTASFLAYNMVDVIQPNCSFKLAHVRLVAVSGENKGWLLKLISELLYKAGIMNVTYVVYPTQLVNKVAIHVCERLGFKLGYSSHILAFS